MLCNAAEEYYDDCEDKEKFANYNALIIDVEKEGSEYAEEKCKYAQLQASKKNVKDYSELSSLAKDTYKRILNGERDAVRKELETNKALLFAISELVVAELIILPASEGLFE